MELQCFIANMSEGVGECMSKSASHQLMKCRDVNGQQASKRGSNKQGSKQATNLGVGECMSKQASQQSIKCRGIDGSKQASKQAGKRASHRSGSHQGLSQRPLSPADQPPHQPMHSLIPLFPNCTQVGTNRGRACCPMYRHSSAVAAALCSELSSRFCTAVWLWLGMPMVTYAARTLSAPKG